MKGNKHKHRIVGGIVLIAFAIILYPFLFTREDVDNSPALTIPDPPGVPAIPRYVEDIGSPLVMPAERLLAEETLAEIAGIGDGSILRTSPSSGGETSQVTGAGESVVVEDTGPDTGLAHPAPIESVDVPAPVTVVPRDVATVVVGNTAQPVQTTPPTMMGEDGLPVSWSLQLAALSSEENTNVMVAKLRAAGHQTYVRKSVAGDKTLFRVYIGPDLDRQKLEKLRPAIDKEYGVKSLTIRFLP